MRYHFHVDDAVPNNDVDGSEFETLEEVERETCRLIGHLLIDGAEKYWRSPRWRVRVVEEGGAPVLTILVMGVRGSMSDPDDRRVP